MLTFQHSEYLNLLWALIPLMLILWYFLSWQKKTISKLGQKSQVLNLLSGVKGKLKIWTGIALLLAIGFLIIALSNPQYGSKPEKAMQIGVDVVMAIDVSKSMMARDLKPNRLENAKNFGRRLLREMPGARLGMIVFAGNAYTQMPLTTDFNAANMYLNVLSTESVPRQGTDYAAAINRANVLFNSGGPQAGFDKTTRKVMVLVTDGENHEKGVEDALRNAKENGIIIYTVSAASVEGAPIPTSEDETFTYMLDEKGNQVISKPDIALLKEIASKTGGKFYSLAKESNVAVDLSEDLSKIKSESKEVTLYTDYDSKYWIFAFAAFLLLMADLLWRHNFKRIKTK